MTNAQTTLDFAPPVCVPASADVLPTHPARRIFRSIAGVCAAAWVGLVVALPVSATDISPVPFGNAVNGFAVAARNNNGRLVSLDFNTPVALTTIGPSEHGAQIWGAGFLNGTLYALGDSGFYSINTVTGALTTISAAPSIDVWGMTVDPTTQTLYWIGGDFGERLSTINPATGATTFVTLIAGAGSTGRKLSAIAANAQGQLYAIDQENDSLITVNKATGAVGAVGPLGVGTLFVAGLTFDPASGTLFFSNGAIGLENIYTINPGTGQATLVGGTQGAVQLVALAIPKTCRVGDTIFCAGFEPGVP